MLLFGSNTRFTEDKKFIYIRTGSSFEDVVKYLEQEDILKNTGSFKWLAQKMGYAKKVKAGKYLINNGAGNYSIINVK